MSNSERESMVETVRSVMADYYPDGVGGVPVNDVIDTLRANIDLNLYRSAIEEIALTHMLRMWRHKTRKSGSPSQLNFEWQGVVYTPERLVDQHEAAVGVKTRALRAWRSEAEHLLDWSDRAQELGHTPTPAECALDAEIRGIKGTIGRLLGNEDEDGDPLLLA